MDLLPLHSVTAKSHPSIRTDCCDLLNNEWPRSQTLRLRSLDSSRPELPICLALVQWFESHPCVVGHARLAAITDEVDAVWIESVVIHPDARGQGVGKYLMLKTEAYCMKELGCKKAYLCTTDQQLFYSKIGYSFCPPVTYYSGNVNLPKSAKLEKSYAAVTKPKKNITPQSVPRVPIGVQAPILPPPPPPPMKAVCSPPPPPPPPMMPKNEEPKAEELKFEDISVTCSKVFRKISLKDIADAPKFSEPLANLGPSAKKGMCKATMHKDYMMKML